MRLSITRRIGALPFHPMALGALSSLQQILETSPNTVARTQALLSLPVKERAEFESPMLFVSPKHDGIRVLTHVPLEQAAAAKIGRPKSATLSKTTKRRPSRITEEEAPIVTCFSRFGRPLRGLFWIEKELELLRELCGDPNLSLDGELYVHTQALQAHLQGASSPPPWEMKGTDGFSLVSGLLQRFRGSAIALPTTHAELLRLTPEIPKYCIFDIVKYSPSLQRFNGTRTRKSLKAIQDAALAASGAPVVSLLAVTPNHTPFVQRLRALNFLMCLLDLHRSHYGSSSAGAGKHVQSVPYKSIDSIHSARTVLMEFTAAGYEGAVIRTSLNRYHAEDRKSGSQNGFRSTTAVKLLPMIEDEFVVWDIVTSPKFSGLECATKTGATFRVPFSSVAPEELQDSSSDLAMLKKLRGSRKADCFVVGTYVTLQFQSRLPSGIPRFPKLKGIRGGAGWYL
ncbi:DNA ligase, putative [Bodo saltans]|uniref:DNA ligase, putative n=1 Tax=Bodo saltans TaxID=75058 RepID=A0A0S4KNF7_BODSA|nr:DNA ligase, putative [Bodo saltans]|eukprot:CUI15152.1 DNA ligase, putative [Bodo saltans]